MHQQRTTKDSAIQHFVDIQFAELYLESYDMIFMFSDFSAGIFNAQLANLKGMPKTQ